MARDWTVPFLFSFTLFVSVSHPLTHLSMAKSVERMSLRACVHILVKNVAAKFGSAVTREAPIKTQGVQSSCKGRVKLGVFEGENIVLGSEVLDTEVEVDLEILSGIQRSPGLPGLVEGVITQEIIGPLTALVLHAFSNGERAEGVDNFGFHWEGAKWTVKTQVSHGSGGGDMDVVVCDATKHPAAVGELKTPKCGLNEMWRRTVQSLQAHDAKYRSLAQVSTPTIIHSRY